MRTFPSVAADDELFARLENRAARRARARAQATPEVAARLGKYARVWQSMSATVALRLAQAGVDAESPQAREVAQADKKKGGFSFGSIVSNVGKLGDSLFSGVDEAVAAVVKPVVRGAALGAQSLYEEAQGVVRNVAAISPEAAGAGVGAALGSIVPGVGTAIGAGVGGALGGLAGHLARDEVKGQVKWEPQSSGAIALGRLLAGEKVELGSGFLPNVMAGESETDPDSTLTIGEEQRSRARNVTVGGMSLTPGRLLAAGVVEPGTKPFNVLSGLTDAAVAFSRFDPASGVLKTGGNVNRNRKLFTSAGGLFSSRPTILPEVAQKWLVGKEGSEVVRKIAETQGDDAFARIWDATGGKFGARLTRDLADATDEVTVRGLIEPVLGRQVRGKVGYASHDGFEIRHPFETFHPLQNVRLAQTMPGVHFDPRNPDEAITIVDRWMKNVKASPELRAKAMRQMADADSEIGRGAALRATMDMTRDVLVQHGVTRDAATAMTKLEETAYDDLRAFYTRSVTDPNVTVPGMYLNGETHSLVNPHMPSEMLNRVLTLPDARDIRRARSGFAAVTNKELYRGAISAVDFAQGQIWKKTALMRGAYTVRVIAEEQFRMAASGLDSLVSHPFSLIAYRLGMKGSDDLRGEEFVYKNAREFADGMDAHNQALNRGFAGWGENVRNLPIWRKFTKQDAGFHKAWASEIMDYSADPFMREIARRIGDTDALKQEWWGNGATRVQDAANGLERIRIRMSEGAGGLRSRDVADRYVDSMVDRLVYKTGGDAELLDVVATGKFRGANVFDEQKFRPTKELTEHLAANTDLLPADVLMKAQMSVVERGAGQMLDKATQWVFSNLMSERTNNLSRSPAFKQFYAQRIEELVPFMDADAQARSIAWAREQKLGDVARRMEAAAKKHGLAAKDAVNYDMVDDIAKGFGLDETRKLLYDMTEKSQFFDAARIIAPFGEAWNEMATRWAKIGMENPQALRRGQQIVTGAREAGFFYQNENGEEVFAYPGSDWISEKLIGVPVPLTGRVAGLSLMTEVLPGVGPVVQFPASAFIQDKPEWDWARNILFPFGEPDTDHGVLESLAPAWLKKFMTSREIGDERMFNSAVMDVARWLVSTGDYDTSTVDGINDVLDDAREKARHVFVLRCAAQFFAPTAPTPEWIVQDKDGRGLVAQKLINEYHDAMDNPEIGPQNATQYMLDRYGDNLFLLLQGKTAEVVVGAPITKPGADWERTNEDVVKSHPDVFGFFAPQDGDLDSAAFDRQMSAGRRVPLTPDQAVRLANARVANAIYQNAKRAIPSPNAQQQAALRTLREALIDRYPGFGDNVGVPENASPAQLVRGLQAAVEDERLADNPVTAPLKQYLEARELAAQAGVARGLSPHGWMSSGQTGDIRNAMRALGAALVAKHPEFSAVFDRVFDREMDDDVEVAA